MDELKPMSDVSCNPLAEKYARMISIQLHNKNWTAAHSMIDQYQAESKSIRPPLTVRQWLAEPICNIPGIPTRLANKVETHFGAIFVEQFLRLIPNESVLLEADNIGPTQVGQIREALRLIGITWPRKFPHSNEIDFTVADPNADHLLLNSKDSAGD